MILTVNIGNTHITVGGCILIWMQRWMNTPFGW